MRKECFTNDADSVSTTTTGAKPTTPKDNIMSRRYQFSMPPMQHLDAGIHADRARTAHTLVSISDCDRVNQLDGEPTRQSRWNSHLRARKSPKSALAHGKHSDQVAQSLIQVAPGYLLARTKQKLKVTINEDFFELSQSEKKSQQAQVNPEIQQLLSDLKQQVADLSLFLEEERFNHNQSKKQAAELLKDKVTELNQDHDQAMKQQKEWHADASARTQETHQQEIETLKNHTDADAARLKSEVEFLQSAFNTFKAQANLEFQNNLKQHDANMSQDHAQKLQSAVSELKSRLTTEKNAEKAKLEKDHAREILRLQKEHKRELEALSRKFASHAEDLEKLQQLEAQIEDEKQKVFALRETQRSTVQELSLLQRSHSEAKAKLSDFEKNFDLKIQLVDDKYQEKMDDLMRTNTELRQMYLKKCEELFKAVSSAEMTNMKRVTSAKEAMKMLIELRHKTNVSMAATDSRLAGVAAVPKDRPCSAPSTKGEQEKALLSAGETKNYEAGARSQRPFVRPHSSVVDFIRLRNPQDPFRENSIYEEQLTDITLQTTATEAPISWEKLLASAVAGNV